MNLHFPFGVGGVSKMITFRLRKKDFVSELAFIGLTFRLRMHLGAYDGQLDRTPSLAVPWLSVTRSKVLKHRTRHCQVSLDEDQL